MERAAFKLTPEYLALLGGKGSELYEEFVDMFTKGLLAARKYATITITMIEIMMFQVSIHVASSKPWEMLHYLLEDHRGSSHLVQCLCSRCVMNVMQVVLHDTTLLFY